MAKFASGEWAGQTIQSLTERTGGSDLAEIETTATPDGDAWRHQRLQVVRVRTRTAQAWVVLAKPEGAPDSARGIATFLVLRRAARRHPQRHPHPPAQGQARHEGGRVGRGRVRRRRGVPAVRARAAARPGAGDGKGLARMMEMTNGARLGIAMMGLGCARRALVEALCYARARTRSASRSPSSRSCSASWPSSSSTSRRRRRSCSTATTPTHRLRIGAPLIKLRAARLGITAASDAIEVHGGNGYVENWPVARILRDAQVNTLWEGPDNILCLDVRRGIEREQADVAFLDRLRDARRPRARRTTRPPTLVARAGRRTSPTRSSGGRRSTAPPPRRGCSRSRSSWSTCTPARCSSSRPGFEQRELGSDRKALVARLYARRHLADRGPLRGIDEPAQRGARAVQGPLGRRPPRRPRALSSRRR